MAQNPLFSIAERHVAKLNAVVEAVERNGLFGIVNLYFGFQNLIYTLHRSQSFGDVIPCFGELFERIDDAVKHY